jgi:hypothetical protein
VAFTQAGRVRWPVFMAMLAVAGVAACSSTTNHPTRVGAGNTHAGGLTVNLASYQAAPFMLRVGQSLVVKVDSARLNWVGGDDGFAGVLKADNPCEATCDAPARTFTAIAPGAATIETVVNCRDLRAPIGATCARGPALAVKVTSAASTGTVTGQLIMEGGAVGARDGGAPPERPLSGLVKFVSSGRQVAAVTVGDNGLFTIRLAAGVYRVEGCTPQIQGVDTGGADVDDCAPPIQTLVRAGVTTAVPIQFIVP